MRFICARLLHVFCTQKQTSAKSLHLDAH